jgi:sugar lactone lactonase YvrE
MRPTRRISIMAVLLSMVAVPVVGLASSPGAGAATFAKPITLTQSPVDSPTAIAMDGAGDLFYSNYYSANSIWVIAPTNTTLFGVSVVANIPTQLPMGGLTGVTNLIVNKSGDLIIAVDAPASSIVAVSSTATTLYGIPLPADTATTLIAPVDQPNGLAFDSAGNLYLTEIDNNQIDMLSSTGGTFFGITVPPDTVTPVASGLGTPWLVATRGGDLYIGDTSSGTVDVVVPTAPATIFGVNVTTANTPTVIMSGLTDITAITFDESGNLYVTTDDPGTVSVLPSTTGTIFGHHVTADTPATVVTGNTLGDPEGLAAAGGALYVANYTGIYSSMNLPTGDSISVISSTAATLYGVQVPADTSTTLVSPDLYFPNDMAVDPFGTVFVASPDIGAVSAFSTVPTLIFGKSVPANTPTIVMRSLTFAPQLLATDGEGDLFIYDSAASALDVISNTSQTIFGHEVTADVLTTIVTGVPSLSAMTFDSQGNLFATVNAANEIVVLSSIGDKILGVNVQPDVLTPVVSTGLADPLGIAISGGTIYTSNFNSGEIVADSGTATSAFGIAVPADTSTVITTIPNSGDPLAIATDSAGDLYIDSLNLPSNSIQVISNGPSSLYGIPVVRDTPTELAEFPNGIASIDTQTGLVVNPSGDLLWADNFNASIEEFASPSGCCPATGGGNGSGESAAPPPLGSAPNTYAQPSSGKVAQGTSLTLTSSFGGATGTVTVPAGALPPGTTVSLYPATNPEGIELPGGQSYGTSFAVSWDLDGQPSPPVASQAVTLTISDPSIGPGDTFYQETTSGLAKVSPSSVTQGSVTFTFTSDPAYVVAIPFISPPAGSGQGYDLVGSDGGVFSFGTAPFLGSLPGMGIHVKNIVGIVPTADDKGYFVVGSDGGVFSFGDASFEGSLPGMGVHVNDIVGIVPTADDKGYFLVGKDGGVFTFGDAKFLGSLPASGTHVGNIVGIAATPDGGGYWIVSSSGVVYTFGDAKTYGNAASGSIVSITATPDDGGYWLTSSNGSVYTQGDADFFGSLPGQGVKASDVVALIPSADSRGYLLVGKDGGTFAFGDDSFPGSLPGLGVHVSNIVGAVPT